MTLTIRFADRLSLTVRFADRLSLTITFADRLSLTVRFADAGLTSVVVSFVLHSVFTVRAYGISAHCQIKTKKGCIACSSLRCWLWSKLISADRRSGNLTLASMFAVTLTQYRVHNLYSLWIACKFAFPDSQTEWCKCVVSRSVIQLLNGVSVIVIQWHVF